MLKKDWKMLGDDVEKRLKDRLLWNSCHGHVGSSGLRIIKKGGGKLIIPKPLLNKNYSSKAFTKLLREWGVEEKLNRN